MNKQRAFTLIELLIVVAIIAILAAVAVPNFLEAQVRSKVARVKSDFRSLGIGIEAYAIDYNQYPYYNPNPAPADLPQKYWAIGYRLWTLTTPVSYVTTVDISDPFIKHGTGGGYNDGWSRTQYNYRYYKVFSYGYNSWVLNCLGPDRTKNKGLMVEPTVRGDGVGTVIYDPTNGTVSAGDIPWTGGDTRYQNR
ncbi:MAG: type II secretion system protein [Candidatus Sumerlaeia bacterium]